jgi:PAS domain S-box-containing protein
MSDTTTIASRRERTIELESLRARLVEAESTLAAIRSGEVDALIVSGESGERVYTLQGAETPYRELVETMNEGAVTLDAAGVVLYANRRFAEMLGQPLERIVGCSLPSLDQSRGLEGMLTEVAEKGRSRREAVLACSGSRSMPVLVSGSRPDGDTSGRMCVIVTDLTSQKRSEALERAEGDARRHRDLAERRATELARSNSDLEAFAYAASHDLKEPLRGISSYSRFVLADHGAELGDEGRAKMDTILRLSGRMHALLDSLLEYARVGRGELVRRPVALGMIAQDVVENLSVFLKESGARVEIADGMPVCSSDPGRLTQVLLNLVTNAVKYNTSTEKRVEIGAGQGKDGFVHLWVRDNGIGIDPRHQERIFGVFRRLHGRDEFGGGMGIGLSLVKTIVEQHGGKVWVESERTKGSTFYVSLPPAAAHHGSGSKLPPSH